MAKIQHDRTHRHTHIQTDTQREKSGDRLIWANYKIFVTEFIFTLKWIGFVSVRYWKRKKEFLEEKIPHSFSQNKYEGDFVWVKIHSNNMSTDSAYTHIQSERGRERGRENYTWMRTSIRLDTFSNKILHVNANEWIFEQLMFFTWKNCSHCLINPFSFILIWMNFRTFAFNDGEFATCRTNLTNNIRELIKCPLWIASIFRMLVYYSAKLCTLWNHILSHTHAERVSVS